MSLNSEDLFAVEQMFLKMIQAIVDDSNAVRLEVTPTATGSLFRVRVGPGDAGKVIGKEGRTARSIRIILGLIGERLHQSMTLDIVSSESADER